MPLDHDRYDDGHFQRRRRANYLNANAILGKYKRDQILEASNIYHAFPEATDGESMSAKFLNLIELFEQTIQ